MDTIAVFTVTSPDGTVLHSSRQRYAHTEKAAEENKMLRSIQKTRKDLEAVHTLEMFSKRSQISGKDSRDRYEKEKLTKNKLTVVFETVQSEIVLDPTKIHLTEKRQILARIGKLAIDDLRAIDLIYC